MFGKEFAAVRDANGSLEEVEVLAVVPEELNEKDAHIAAGGSGALSARMPLQETHYQENQGVGGEATREDLHNEEEEKEEELAIE